jgi:hypothetical protein
VAGEDLAKTLYQAGGDLAMTLKDFQQRIDNGGAACRVDAWDSALVFRLLDGVIDSYYVASLHNGHQQECLTWNEVLDEVGKDWAQADGWQVYRLSLAEVQR